MEKNKFIIVLILIVIGVVIGADNVNADSTVLYNDGTLIINELDAYRDTNIDRHGAVLNEYEPLSEDNRYVFNSKDDVLWKNEIKKIKKVYIGQIIKPTSTAWWFSEASSLFYANMEGLNTKNVTNMESMFENAGDEIDTTVTITGLFGFDTSKVINMSNMFNGTGCTANKLDIANDEFLNWDVSNVINMKGMFTYTDSIDIDLSRWDTSSVTDMSYMFYWTSGSYGDLSNWNTSSVTDMSYMFENSDSSFGSLSKWDTSKVTNMSYMFYEYRKNARTFNIGDISNWNTSNVTNMNGMFMKTGASATTFNSIGNLTIPKNCAYIQILNGAKSFVGNLYFEKGLSVYGMGKDGHFANAAIKPGAELNLYFYGYSGLLDRNMELYGPNGTYSQGNINVYYILSSDGLNSYWSIDNLVNKTYNGKKQTQNIKIIYNGKNLVQDIDYTVNYQNNVNVGTATVIITGLGNYTGSIVKTFEITAPIYDAVTSKIVTNLTKYNAIKVVWNKVSGAAGYKICYLKPGASSYTCKYTTSNSNSYTGLLSGKKYSFKVYAYKIDGRGNKLVSTKYKSVYTYTLKKLNTPSVVKSSKYYVKVKWSRISGVISGYQISRSTKKTGTNVIKTAKSTLSYYKIKTTRNKKYYYKVRAYKLVNGKKIYSPWSNVKYYKLK